MTMMRGYFTRPWWFCCCLFLLLEFSSTIISNNSVVTASAAATATAVSEEQQQQQQQQQTCSADDETCQANNNLLLQEDSDEEEDDDDDEEDDGLPGKPNPNCVDDNEQCEMWASSGECKVNPPYMLQYCKKSCFVCNERIYTKEELEIGLDLGVQQNLEPPLRTSKFAGITKEQVITKIQESRDFIKNDDYLLPNVKQICRNQHKACSFWAVGGECESNKKYMDKTCTAACQSCIMLTREGRCPIDPNEPNAWQPGDLDKMFTRLTQEPYLSKYDVTILSSPNMKKAKTTTTDGDGEDDGGPWVITMENVLTKEEAESLIELGTEEGYKRSSDVGKLNADGTFEKNVSEGRTSTNAWCQHTCWKHPVSQRIAERLANITGIPDANSEYLQLLKYEPGQKYNSHHDYIPHHIRRQQGVRILTLYLYLSEVEAGGGTNFDALNVTVMPKVGRALLWPSVMNDDPNIKDDRTSHQALPVEAGIKYGANAWFHMRDFKGPNSRNCG